MRSDSPRVAAAQESRRTSLNNAASKRLSLDKEFLENNLVNGMGNAYDSPTMLPRRPIIPDSLMSSPTPEPETAHSTKEEDQSSTVSMTETAHSTKEEDQ